MLKVESDLERLGNDESDSKDENHPKLQRSNSAPGNIQKSIPQNSEINSCPVLITEMKKSSFDVMDTMEFQGRVTTSLVEMQCDFLAFLLHFYAQNIKNWSILFKGNKDLVFSTCSRGNTLLHYACRYNIPVAVDQLLEINDQLLHVKNKDGYTAFHVCCRHDFAYIAESLVISCSKFTDPFLHLYVKFYDTTVDGDSFLAVSVKTGALEVTRKLMLHYPLWHHKSKISNLPILVLAMQQASHDISDTEFRLNFHSKQRQRAVLKFLLHYYAVNVPKWSVLFEPNKKLVLSACSHGNTLLHYASKYNFQRAARKLLKVSTELLSIKNHNGDTALHICSIENHVDIARLLISKGMNVNLVKKSGYCALATACKHGHKEMATMLMKNGANINSALHLYTLNSTQRKYPTRTLLRMETPNTWTLGKTVPLLLLYGAAVNEPWHGALPLNNFIDRLWSQVGYPCVHIKRDIVYLISGGAFTNDTELLTYIERLLCHDKKEESEFYPLLLRSGHRFQRDLELLEVPITGLPDVYSLSTLCGKVIRTNLFPNAWFSVDKLPLPTAFKNLVVLDYGGYKVDDHA